MKGIIGMGWLKGLFEEVSDVFEMPIELSKAVVKQAIIVPIVDAAEIAKEVVKEVTADLKP